MQAKLQVSVGEQRLRGLARLARIVPCGNVSLSLRGALTCKHPCQGLLNLGTFLISHAAERLCLSGGDLGQFLLTAHHMACRHVPKHPAVTITVPHSNHSYFLLCTQSQGFPPSAMLWLWAYDVHEGILGWSQKVSAMSTPALCMAHLSTLMGRTWHHWIARNL